MGYAFSIMVNAVAYRVKGTDIVNSLPENLKRIFLENIPVKRGTKGVLSCLKLSQN